jgi:hypothetical protein
LFQLYPSLDPAIVQGVIDNFTDEGSRQMDLPRINQVLLELCADTGYSARGSVLCPPVHSIDLTGEDVTAAGLLSSCSAGEKPSDGVHHSECDVVAEGVLSTDHARQCGCAPDDSPVRAGHGAVGNFGTNFTPPWQNYV